MSLIGKLFGRGKPSLDWLIVGLGNPGKKYYGTRHNAGAMVLKALARNHFSEDIEEVHSDARFQAKVAKGRLSGQKVMMMFPQTFMNHSGNAVISAINFFKVPPDRVLVIFDDKDIPLGSLRLRSRGSAGGHNGMKSVIERLGTQEIPRLRIGIGTDASARAKSASFVLGYPSEEERSQMNEAIDLAAKAVEAVLNEGVEKAMNRFN